MTKTTPQPVACPCCYEPLIEPHDLARCKTIGRAFMLENSNMGDEVSYQIMSLIYWLRDHPAKQGNSRRAHARDARRQFLDHYIELAQAQK